jgi:hypothetical protein
MTLPALVLVDVGFSNSLNLSCRPLGKGIGAWEQGREMKRARESGYVFVDPLVHRRRRRPTEDGRIGLLRRGTRVQVLPAIWHNIGLGRSSLPSPFESMHICKGRGLSGTSRRTGRTPRHGWPSIGCEQRQERGQSGDEILSNAVKGERGRVRGRQRPQVFVDGAWDGMVP